MATRTSSELLRGCQYVGLAELPPAAAACTTADELLKEILACASHGRVQELQELLKIVQAINKKYPRGKRPIQDHAVTLWETLDVSALQKAVATAAAAGRSDSLTVLLDHIDNRHEPDLIIPFGCFIHAAKGLHWDALQYLFERSAGRIHRFDGPEKFPGVAEAIIRADAVSCLQAALVLLDELNITTLGLLTFACSVDAENCARHLLQLDGMSTVDPQEKNDAPIKAAARHGSLRALSVLLEINDAALITSMSLYCGVMSAIEHGQMPALLALLWHESDEDACLEKHGHVYCRHAARLGRRFMLAELFAAARQQGETLFPEMDKEEEGLQPALKQGRTDAPWFATACNCGRKGVLLRRFEMRGRGRFGLLVPATP